MGDLHSAYGGKTNKQFNVLSTSFMDSLEDARFDLYNS